MRTMVQLAGIVTALTVIWSVWSPASAANVVFVSATSGTDGAACGAPTAPCRSLSFALTKAFTPDDVIQLDSGGNYFSTTINNQSIIIYSPHGAAIFGGESPCLTINNDVDNIVTLDGIICIPDSSHSGIVFNSGRRLRIRNSRVHYAGSGFCGISFQPSNTATLLIERSLVGENGTSSAGGGVCIAPTNNASVSATIDHLTAQNNRFGLRTAATGTSKINLMLQNSIFSNNLVGVLSSGANSEVRFSNDTIYQNTTGIKTAAGGALISFGDNLLSSNGVDGAFTSPEAKQ
jgi:hypothetical protein